MIAQGTSSGRGLQPAPHRLQDLPPSLMTGFQGCREGVGLIWVLESGFSKRKNGGRGGQGQMEVTNLLGKGNTPSVHLSLCLLISLSVGL